MLFRSGTELQPIVLYETFLGIKEITITAEHLAIVRTSPLDELRAAFFQRGFLALPPTARQQLHSDPAAYFAARATDLANPFAVAMLPPQEDWLGFSRFLPAPLAAHWQADGAGYLVREADGRRWLLIRVTLADAPNILNKARLIPLIEDRKSVV